MTLFTRNVKEPFHLTLFNLGATNFAESAGSGSLSIQKAFKTALQPVINAPTAPVAGHVPGKALTVLSTVKSDSGRLHIRLNLSDRIPYIMLMQWHNRDSNISCLSLGFDSREPHKIQLPCRKHLTIFDL